MAAADVRERLTQLLVNSYAPYSHMRFACILETQNGRKYEGVNVENASFGATVCAERNALHAAITQGDQTFTTLYLMTDARKPMMPCMLCKQSFTEFFTENVRFVLMTKCGQQRDYMYEQILQGLFSKDDFFHKRSVSPS